MGRAKIRVFKQRREIQVLVGGGENYRDVSDEQSEACACHYIENSKVPDGITLDGAHLRLLAPLFNRST